MATMRSASLLLSVIAAFGLAACTSSPSTPAPAPAPVTVTAPPASPSTSQSPVSVGDPSPTISDAEAERIFLKLLDDQGLEYSSADKVIKLGRAVCQDFGNGISQTKIVDDIMANSDFTAYQSGYIVGAAQGSFCPKS